MTNRALRFVLVAAALTAAACTDKQSSPLAPSSGSAGSAQPSFSANSASGASGLDVAAIHVMQTKSDALSNAANGASKGGGGSGIFYHGGPVLQAGTKVAAVYWAASTIYAGGPAAGTVGTGSGDGSLVGFFLSNLGGSPYFNINHSYTDGAGQAIVNSVSYTQFWANNASVPANGQSVTDAQMIAMLQTGFTSGALTYDAGTLYHIFTAGTVNLGGGFGTQYCAYHTHGTVSIGGVAKTVLYSAMPYTFAFPTACTNQTASPNGDAAADAEVNVIAHETEETTTDMMANAWYDRRGYENADKCAWTWGTTYKTSNGGVANMNLGGKDFLVQQNWVNSGSGGCVLKF